MSGPKSNTGYYELLFAALLHDIGKVLQRGRIGVSEEYKTHDELGSKLINEYRDLFEKIGLNSEIVRLLIRYHHHALRRFRPPKIIRDLLLLLEKADRESASERNMGDEIYSKQKSSIHYLVSPLWIVDYYKRTRKYDNVEKLPKSSYICYKPFSVIAELRGRDPLRDLEIIEEKLKVIECFSKDSGIEEYYIKIYEDLVEVLDALIKAVSTGVIGVEELLETLSNYIRYSLLFVPDALYGVEIPSTSLSVHLLLTAAMASSFMLSGCSGDMECSLRIGLLDLSGIQKYIALYARRKGALRQIRGRSLLLQLVMRASAYKLLRELGLNTIHLVLDRGDSAFFILPNTVNEKIFENAVGKVEEAIYRLFHGDIYVAYGLSDPFKPTHEPPWSAEFGKKGFSKAMIDLGKRVLRSKRNKFKLLSLNSRAINSIKDENDNRLINECPLCKATLFEENMLSINERKSKELGLEENIINVCPSCLLAHIAGYAAENLVFILEIRSKNITDKLFEELKNGKINAKNKKVKYGVIPLKGLDVTFILISDISEKSINHWSSLKNFMINELSYFINKYRGKEDISIIIYKNNDPGDFIPRGEDMVGFLDVLKMMKNIRIGFSVFYTNISLKYNELDDLAKANDRQTLLSWLKIDGDRMGFTGLHLIGSLSRYMTFNELVNLYTNLIGHLILYKRAKLLDGKSQLLKDKVIVVYSGGDDSLIVSRFVEGLYYLSYYHEWFTKFFGKIGEKRPLTVSAGMILRESDYPSYLAYIEAVQSLEKAKNEGRNRVYSEPLSINVQKMESLPWEHYKLFIDKSTDEDLSKWVALHKQQSYKLLWLARSIVEFYYKYMNEEDIKEKNEYYRRTIEYLIAYIYIYNRLRKLGGLINKLMDSKILSISLEPRVIIEYYSKHQVNKTIINEFNKLARFLSLLLLRMREKL